MLKIYNTLTRTKQELVPSKKGLITMYSCGPTVYNYAHIGNLRTYIFMDLVRRALKMQGYKIKGVLNITDVGHLVNDSDTGEDKMSLTAKAQNKSPYEIADYYTKVFFDDIEALNIGKPEIIAKATGHINEMIEYVVGLEKKGYAYETSDGIYFDILKFNEYGKLSGINLEDQQAGARVEINSEKHHPADFALWKKAPKEHIMQWPSPWGMGYPGWHIECSAMCKKYLGKVADIHTGGVDHIPIHHENEIAQSEALEGAQTVNYWMHGEFMLVDNGKMSKSLGNTYTVTQLKDMGYDPLDFRYFCLNAHYRKKLNFTFEGLTAARTALMRLREALAMHKASDIKTGSNKIEGFFDEFSEAVSDDINVPLALGVLWTALKEPKSRDIYELALRMDKVFGLDLHKSEPAKRDETQEAVPEEIAELAKKRLTAKKEKNYAESDRLRALIISSGYSITDTADGYVLKKNEEKFGG